MSNLTIINLCEIMVKIQIQTKLITCLKIFYAKKFNEFPLHHTHPIIFFWWKDKKCENVFHGQAKKERVFELNFIVNHLNEKWSTKFTPPQNLHSFFFNIFCIYFQFLLHVNYPYHTLDYTTFSASETAFFVRAIKYILQGGVDVEI